MSQTIFLEEKGVTVEFPDGLSQSQMEQVIFRDFYDSGDETSDEFRRRMDCESNMFNPEERKNLIDQGKIGFFEGASRNVGALFDVLGIPGAVGGSSLFKASRRIQDADGADYPERTTDEILFENYLRQQEEERIRGKYIRGSIGEGIMDVPIYMLEFLSGG